MADEIITKEEAFKFISEAFIYGNLGLFIGAGFSKAVINEEQKVLSWKELLKEVIKSFNIENFDINMMEGKSYPEQFSYLVNKISEKENTNYTSALRDIKRKIAEICSWFPNKEQRDLYGGILKKIKPSWIVTTNYDSVLECLLFDCGFPLGPDDVLISSKDLIPIYHLHGIKTNPDSIIITQEDYVSLFRPNEYRQQKLPLIIKESTTLIVGYGLGDINVLTAIDWAKNVYKQKITYPNEVIQLLYVKDKMLREPYWKNDILIIEFNNLQDILTEISNFISKEEKQNSKENENLGRINEILKNPSEQHIKDFIDDHGFREDVITNCIIKHGYKLLAGFMELFSKAMDECRKRTIPNGAFEAYNQRLVILLDLLKLIPLDKMPPILLESIEFNFANLAYYIGEELGKSHSAFKTWNKEKLSIPKYTLKELFIISEKRHDFALNDMLIELINSNQLVNDME
jgi:hypothetical protein